ncbi:hypothetical protein AHF37_02808 [Paragonimus kellicotti]|nr:hypothetical protein AHF37_02808 [Paragonimus kellicotti]
MRLKPPFPQFLSSKKRQLQSFCFHFHASRQPIESVLPKINQAKKRKLIVSEERELMHTYPHYIYLLRDAAPEDLLLQTVSLPVDTAMITVLRTCQKPVIYFNSTAFVIVWRDDQSIREYVSETGDAVIPLLFAASSNLLDVYYRLLDECLHLDICIKSRCIESSPLHSNRLISQIQYEKIHNFLTLQCMLDTSATMMPDFSVFMRTRHSETQAEFVTLIKLLYDCAQTRHNSTHCLWDLINPSSIQHADLLTQLRPYQVDAVNWMAYQESHVLQVDMQCLHRAMFWPVLLASSTQRKVYFSLMTGTFVDQLPTFQPPCLGGILADEMGLGKTLELIALILLHPWSDWSVSGGRLRTLDGELCSAVFSDYDAPTPPMIQDDGSCRVLCSCGNVDEMRDFPLVQCTRCDGPQQHAVCVQYDPSTFTDRLPIEHGYICPQCWSHVDQLPTFQPPCLGGILADEMGLGKTLELIALILLHPWSDWSVSGGRLRTLDGELCSAVFSDYDAPTPPMIQDDGSCRVLCSCGNVDEMRDFPLVQCTRCDGPQQHAVCVQYDPSTFTDRLPIEHGIHLSAMLESFTHRFKSNTYCGSGSYLAAVEGRTAGTCCSWLNRRSYQLPTFQPPCLGGILADEMGLGKTLELIALILLHPWSDWSVSGGRLRTLDGELCSAVFSDYDAPTPPMIQDDGYACIDSKATLIVAPDHIWQQWKEELQAHVARGSIDVLLYAGMEAPVTPVELGGRASTTGLTSTSVNPYAPRTRVTAVRTAASQPEQMEEELLLPGFVQPGQLACADIVLTSYSVVQRELDWAEVVAERRSGLGHRPGLRLAPRYLCRPSPLTCVRWWRVCLDEAQMVERITSKTARMMSQIDAKHRWCVTGTPAEKSIDVTPVELGGRASTTGLTSTSVNPYAPRTRVTAVRTAASQPEQMEEELLLPGFVQPGQLACADIVLTSYSVVQRELDWA